MKRQLCQAGEPLSCLFTLGGLIPGTTSVSVTSQQQCPSLFQKPLHPQWPSSDLYDGEEDGISDGQTKGKPLIIAKREPQAESPSTSNPKKLFLTTYNLQGHLPLHLTYRFMHSICLKFNLIWALSSYNILCYSFAQDSLTILVFLPNDVFPFCICFVVFNLTD